MKQLTLKQKMFAQEYVKNGGNGTQAARASYNANYGASKVIGFQNLQKPHVKAYLEELLDGAGLSDEAVSRHLNTIVKEGVASKTAEAKDALKALDMTLRLKDRYPSQKLEATTRNINIDFNAFTPDELLKKLEEITEENVRLVETMSKGKLSSSMDKFA